MNRPYIICHMTTSLDGKIEEYCLVDLKNYNEIIWMNYRRNT